MATPVHHTYLPLNPPRSALLLAILVSSCATSPPTVGGHTWLDEWRTIEAIHIQRQTETQLATPNNAPTYERCNVTYRIDVEEQELALAPAYEVQLLEPTADPALFEQQLAAMVCMAPAIRVEPDGETLVTDAAAFSQRLQDLVDHFVSRNPEMMQSAKATEIEAARNAASIEALNERAAALWLNLIARPHHAENVQQNTPCPEGPPEGTRCTTSTVVSERDITESWLTALDSARFSLHQATLNQKAILIFRPDQPMFATMGRELEQVLHYTLRETGEEKREVVGRVREITQVAVEQRQTP